MCILQRKWVHKFIDLKVGANITYFLLKNKFYVVKSIKSFLESL